MASGGGAAAERGADDEDDAFFEMTPVSAVPCRTGADVCRTWLGGCGKRRATAWHGRWTTHVPWYATFAAGLHESCLAALVSGFA